MRPILDYCESRRDWALETVEALAALESPSDDKAAVDRCGAELERRLRAIGGRVERLSRERAGDHLRAEFGAGSPQILVLGHFDTVWPVGQIATMPLCRRDGRLHGPGTFDMKAGIAIGMLATRALADVGPQPPGRLVLLFTTDEETGSATSRDIVEHEATSSAAVFVLEPSLPGGAVKTRRKGGGEFTLTVRGKAAHAGIDAGRGASAILEIARQVVGLQDLNAPERGVTLNVGVISGGTRSNVVADEARAVIDVRVPTGADAALVSTRLSGLQPLTPGTSLEVAGGMHRPPLERTPAVARLYELARDVAREIGRDLQEGDTGGGSDGNFTAALGVPTLDGLGAIGDGAHALHEHIVIDELPWRAALLAGLILRAMAR